MKRLLFQLLLCCCTVASAVAAEQFVTFEPEGDAIDEMPAETGRIRELVGQCIMPREGIFGIVLEGGTVKENDEITIV